MRDLGLEIGHAVAQNLNRRLAGACFGGVGRSAGGYVRFTQNAWSNVAVSTVKRTGARLMRSLVKTITKYSPQHTFLAVGFALFAGLLANLLLWPREQLPTVAPVDQYDYFSAAFIERATEFRGLQSLLGLASLLVLLLVPLVIALWWPRGRAGGDRGAGRRTGALAGAAVGTGVALAALLAVLPVSFVAYLRSRDYGLSLQPPLDWFADQLLVVLLLAVGTALLAGAALVLIRRLPRAWPPALAALVVMLACILQLLAPLLLEPLFADFKPLPAGAVRNDVRRVAALSGVDAGAIYVVDAASRTTAANAYVSGLGSTKRVVLYDTLLRDYTPSERRNVIAHEFGHAHYGDLRSGLLWFALVTAGSVYGVALLAQLLARRRGVRLESPAGVAMLAAAAMLAMTVSQPAAAAYSRRVEARADAFALRVTGEPQAAIALERRITMQNLVRPMPPTFPSRLLGTHPAPVDRIGMALTVKRARR